MKKTEKVVYKCVHGLCYSQLPHLDCWLNYITQIDFDHIFVSISSISFTGISSNSFQEELNILKNWIRKDKRIIIIHGHWTTEENARNHVLKLAKLKSSKGLFFTIDIDEYWDISLLADILQYHKNSQKNNVAYWYYKEELFKHINIRIRSKRLPISVVIHYNNQTQFISKRLVNSPKQLADNQKYFWHLGLVGTEEYIHHKLLTFGHSKEVPSNWFESQWINLDFDSTRLCRKGTNRWNGLEIFDYKDELPEYLKNHVFFNQTYKDDLIHNN